MPRNWHQRVDDILTCIARIKSYTEALSFYEFENNQLVIDGVLRNFSIIGEAVRHISDNIQSKNPHVLWAQIKGMRNIIAHEYFGVSLEILWHSIQNEILVLEDQLKKIVQD